MLGTITLTVGQTDAMPQIEEVPEMTEVLQDEVCPKVNGEQEENESADKTSATSEEKVAEEKPDESNEVGFKKIFRFVGFKFTLKKDKNEKTEPVQLLTVKEMEDGVLETAAEKTKEEDVTGKDAPSDESKTDAAEAENGDTTEKAPETEAPSADLPETDAVAETVTDGADGHEENPAQGEQPVEEAITPTEKEKEGEAVPQAESDTTTSAQEIQSPLKRFFTQGIFSNLRKKTSFKKSKEEEQVKEKPAEEDIKETEEKVEEAATDGEQVEEVVEKETASEQTKTPEEPEKAEATSEEASPVAQEQEEKQLNLEAKEENEIAPEQKPEPTTCEAPKAPAADTDDDTKPTKAEEKPADSAEEQPEKSPADTTEAEVLSSQDKAKAQGSPLKKLFTGAGLKKLSSKKQKGKKETNPKLTESGEQAGEQIQSPTEPSTEVQKPSSEASSPEDSGEHIVAEEAQTEVSVEAEGEAATSDSEKKKDGILPWASFKKLVTPKKRVKRPSESEDDTPGDKPKSATLSSNESAGFEEKTEEMKSNDKVTDEAKEEPQAECKPETKAEKLEQSTEEPKRKMDTSVSWEALICVGSAKKRARKTSDSDEEEAKIEEEAKQSEEDQAKTTESPLVSSQEADHENLASSPEPEGELVSTWESFKRLVTQRKKPKAEDKSDESSAPEQATSDSEIPKEESSFSLRKLIPRRKKKSDGKQGQASSDVGSAEEDSDTPAVVPLSEYDSEQAEKVSAEAAETEKPKPEITAVTPGKVSAEDRSPSWIPATVEGIEDEAEAKLLSDIPEEGDAATPKSADNTIADEIVDFTSEAVTAHEPIEETEMVSALSRITGSPVTSGDTSPVPGDGVLTNTEVILQEAVETITVTSTAMAVTVTEEQTSCIAASNIPFQVESATKEKEVELIVHEKAEVTTVCTSLDTNNIEDVSKDSPLTASLEAVTAVSEALSVEGQSSKPEEAEVTEDNVCEAQVHEVQAICKEQAEAPVVSVEKETEKIEAVMESVAQTVTEVQEVAVVTAVQQEAETVEDLVEAKNTPKVAAESPVKPTVEVTVCEQTVEVTEVAVVESEEVQKLENVEESIAVVAEAPVVEEVTTTYTDDSIVVTTVSQEAPVPVASAVPEEVCVSPSETEEVDKAAASVEDYIKCASSSVTAVEGISEEVQKDVELSQAVHVTETEAFQVQSTVIVQEVIQNVVENLEMLESSATVLEEAPTSDEIVDGEERSAAQEEKAAADVPAEVEEPSTDVQDHEKPEPVTEETENRAEQEQTQIITEKSPESVSEAVQISETVMVSTADEIKAEQDEVASVSVEAIQESTAVEKQELELQTCEVKEEKENTESGDGTSKVEEDLTKATTETPASDPPAQAESDLTATVSTMQTQMLEVVSQQVQGIQIETMTDISVGIIHVVDADKEEKKDDVKEDASQSQEEDTAERVLEEAQKDVSAKDIKGDEGSGNDVCQEAKSQASEVNAAVEATTNAVEDEEVGSPATTEVASMS
ncbi:A-kinase anchor protein 12b isoform X2 [Trichomycterus rosablanca]|uniref:A-kinase anchor protein 12b isoform X2 n=1 Tax=Trichomycterus rosablanca TaxID=2290929 RepID=UPI002F3575D9